MSGLTPRRTLEKMSCGSVVDPGPETKLVITRSSHDRMNASSHAETTLGAMIGSVITRNTFIGRAPRSSAASSSERSKVLRRAWTTTVAYAMQKVMWAMVIVVAPRPAGQPKVCSIATKSSSIDRPVMTSGSTIGAVVSPIKRLRPRKLPKRTRQKAAMVARIVEPVALTAATRKLRRAASRISPFASSSAYHFSVGECAESQTVTSREALNE